MVPGDFEVTEQLISGGGQQWTSRAIQMANSQITRIAIDMDLLPMSYSNVIQHWQSSAAFRNFFIGLLADSPFSAFRWETPSVTTVTANQPFEFVLLNSPGLEGRPDPAAFAEHFIDTAAGGVVEFPNLGGDATMVAPCPDDQVSDFGHLAAFCRHASELQQHSLWKVVGTVMKRRLGPRPVWLSTAGGGVAWLHVRLDDRPKYYGYAQYRKLTP